MTVIVSCSGDDSPIYFRHVLSDLYICIYICIQDSWIYLKICANFGFELAISTKFSHISSRDFEFSFITSANNFTCDNITYILVNRTLKWYWRKFPVSLSLTEIYSNIYSGWIISISWIEYIFKICLSLFTCRRRSYQQKIWVVRAILMWESVF